MAKFNSIMVLVGMLLIVGGAVGAGVTLNNNLPSPFDIASASVSGDNSLPIIAPANSGSDLGGGSVIQAGAPTVNPGESYVPAATPQPRPVGLIPDRLVIPAINLDASIIPTSFKELKVDGKVYYQWLSPDKFVVGWQDPSALLGMPGNTVLNGHHNSFGKVFKDLVKLNVGDEISIYSGSVEFRYQVVAKMLLPERQATLSTRLENARWIETSTDERITLITCWPADSNTHRVVIVAFPISGPDLSTPTPTSQSLQVIICYDGTTKTVNQSDLGKYPNYMEGACPLQTSKLTIKISVNENYYSQAGDVLHYNYLVTNTSNLSLNEVGVTDNKTKVGCPKITLEPGKSMTCQAIYSVRNADAAAENIVNTAQAIAKSGDVSVDSLPYSQRVVRFQNLILYSRCAADPSANDGWQVKNDNSYNVDFEYDLDGGAAGVGVAPANSMVTFDTPFAGHGTGVMTLYVGGFLQNNAIAIKGCT